MTLVDDLKAAKALIDTPEKWIKDRWADDDKLCFCTWGAILHSFDRPETTRLNVLFDVVAAGLPSEWMHGYMSSGRLIAFNDHPATTHADVLALFDRAIAAAEASAS